MKTIRMIADEIGVTKATLQKRISRGSLYTRLYPYISTIEGTKYIDETGETIIKEAFEKKPFGNQVYTSIGTGIDISVDGDTHSKTEIDNALVELLREQMADFRQQLAIKDKQINDLNDRLAESNAALVSAQQTLQAEQALHAGTIQSRLLAEKSQDDVSPKPSLWNKIFKRKE